MGYYFRKYKAAFGFICILTALLILLFIYSGDTRKISPENREKGVVYTEEGYETSCRKVKVEGKEYFRCRTYGPHFILTPVSEAR